MAVFASVILYVDLLRTGEGTYATVYKVCIRRTRNQDLYPSYRRAVPGQPMKLSH